MFGLLTARAAFALLAVVWTLLTLLYWLRPQRRRVAVPFMPLWDALLQSEPTTRLLGRLQRVGSLLIALLTSALLVLALTDPKPDIVKRATRTRLVLIDAGQHMQATDIAPSRLEAARALVNRLIREKAPNDIWLIGQLDADVTPLGPRSSDPAALHVALQRLAATDAATNLGSAAAFANTWLRSQPNPALWLVSDGAFDAPSASLDTLRRSGIGLRQLAIGSSARNVGIRSFSARRTAWDKSQSELMLEIENAGSAAEYAELTLRGDGMALIVTEIPLAPHSMSRHFYSEVPARVRQFEAELSLRAGHDALTGDDRAVAVLPALSRRRILLVSTGNRYLEAALLLDPSHDVSRVAPDLYRGPAGHDLLVFDRYTPDSAPGVPCLFIAPPASASNYPLAIRDSVERPSFDTFDEHHPLLQAVTLRDVNIARARRTLTQPGDAVVAAAGKTPLIVAGERAGQRFVALTFDVRDSDLPLRVAWPVLFSHAIDWLLPPVADYQAPLVIGQQQHVSIPGSATHVNVTAPNGARDRASVELDAQARTFGLRPMRVGFYDLELAGDRQTWAAVRDPMHSVSIQPQQVVQAQPVEQSTDSVWLPDQLWFALLAVVWIIVCLEWFSYQRRWTL